VTLGELALLGDAVAADADPLTPGGGELAGQVPEVAALRVQPALIAAG